MKPTFTVSEVIKTSWDLLKKQIVPLVGIFIGYMIVAGIISFIISPSTPSVGRQLLGSLISLCVSSFFVLGYYKNLFQTIDGMEPQFSAYKEQAPKLVTAILTSLLIGIIVIIGMFLLILPGIYLALRLQFSIMFIVEENTGVIDSMKRSWAITDGQILPLFVLVLASIGIGIVGALLLGVGLFVAMPLIYMMLCYTYRILNKPLAVAEEVVEDIIETE